MAKNPRLIDLTGQKFGRLVVIKQAGNSPGGGAIWECRCECGTTSKPMGADLRAGKVRSCGCLSSDVTASRNYRHGLGNSRLYTIWQNMKKRCADKSNKDYGGKGISVCKEWLNFEPFAKWATSTGYSDELTIERADNSKGYTPKNCSWIERGKQAYNRTIVPTDGNGTPWVHVARRNGITRSAYANRVQDGWSYEEAATWPMFKRHIPRLKDSKGRFC